MTAWYHGGVPGLEVGELLLPPDISGTRHTLSAYASEPHGQRRDVVYLARIQDHARAYAALYPDGAVYRAEPIGATEPDPDAPGFSVMCAQARVVEVVRSRVVFAHRSPESWFAMLGRAS